MLRLRPGDAAALAGLGASLKDADQPDRAAAVLSEAVRLHPDFGARLDAAVVWETKGAAALVMAGERLNRIRRLMMPGIAERLISSGLAPEILIGGMDRAAVVVQPRNAIG